MTAIDWVILAFTILLAFYGYLQGFLVGGLSLLGFALGAFIGTRVGPLLVPGGSHSHYAALFGLVNFIVERMITHPHRVDRGRRGASIDQFAKPSRKARVIDDPPPP